MPAHWWTIVRIEGEWLATPREDIDVAELEEERARLTEDARRRQRELPPWE